MISKLHLLKISFFIILIYTSVIYSQISLQAGVGGGIIFPLSDYTGSTIDYYAGKNYGLSSGYNFHAKALAGFLSLNVFAQIDYSSLSNSGESEPGKGKVEVKHNILSIKAGPEFHLRLPLTPIKPYLNAFLSFNNFSGETIFNGVAKVPSGTHSFSTVSRFGAGVGLGVVFKLGPIMTLDFGAQYNFLNLLGKTWEDVNPTKEQRLDSYLALNDDKDPLIAIGSDDHFINSSRTINSLQITVTLMFGL